MTAAPDQPAPELAGPLTPADVAVPLRAGVDLVHGPDGALVAVLGEPSRHTASLLSCRLHEALDTVGDRTELVVDLGVASAADPAIARVLLCARESATDRGIAFAVR